MSIKLSDDIECPKALNTLCRHKMIYKLLNDIRVDIEVCKLEGYDYKEYLLAIREIIDGFLEISKGENR